MKRKRSLILTVFFVTLVFSLNTFAQYQNYMQFSLPDGARARLNKGYFTGDIMYSPNGKHLAVPSSIGIWIYDAETGEEQRLLVGHSDIVSYVSFSPDGTTIASGSDDGTVRLWDANTGDHKATFSVKVFKDSRHEKTKVWSLSFSPDGTTIAVGSSHNYTVRFWDVNTREFKNSLKYKVYASSLSYSPDGTTLATGDHDGMVQLWDANTGEFKRNFDGHTDRVTSVSYSPDGTTIASRSSDGTRLWSAQHNNTIELLNPSARFILGDNTDSFTSVSYSPDGTTIATGSNDGMVKLWDANTGNLKRKIETHRGYVSGVSYSPDGTTIAVRSWDLSFWDVNTGKLKREIVGYNRKDTHLTYSPDGTTIATITDNSTVMLLNPNTGERKQFVKYSEEIDCLSYSPDGTILATGVNGKITLWDVNTKERKTTLWGYFKEKDPGKGALLSFSPDGSACVVSDGLKQALLWDANTGEHKHSLSFKDINIHTLSFSPDGTTIAIGSSYYKDYNPTLRGIIYFWDGRTSYVDPLDFLVYSPDGSTIACANRKTGEIDLYDRNGSRIKILNGGMGGDIRCLLYSPDGIMLLTGLTTGIVELWDVNTYQFKRALKGHNGEIHALSYSPDGNTLATASSDGTVLLWDMTR